MNPPLFLRFLNLLMNDAIFLLDEAIQVGLRVQAPASPSAVVLAPLKTAGCGTDLPALVQHQLAAVLPTVGWLLAGTDSGAGGRCPGRRQKVGGPGMQHVGHSLPSPRSREAGQDKEQQRGFFRMQHEACWGSCEEICPLVIWTQSAFK